jgi:hypothetical protein
MKFRYVVFDTESVTFGSAAMGKSLECIREFGTPDHTFAVAPEEIMDRENFSVLGEIKFREK